MNMNEKVITSKSYVWNYFKKKDSTSASCNICLKVLKHGGNTTNLKQHIERKHKLQLKQDKYICEEPSNVDDPNSIAPCKRIKSIESTNEENINQAFERINSFTDGGTSSNKITNSIIHMITKDNLPISMVENKGVQHLMKTIPPLYTLPSRKTITRLIDEKYTFLKDKFKNAIRHVPSFTLTCDIWTDNTNKSYLGITLHYLKNEVTMTNACIGVFVLEHNHTSDYISEMLLSVIDSFGITASNITAIVTDSASNMKKAINQSFTSTKHLPCFAHIISHLVPDALKQTPDVEKIISKIKTIVTVFKRSVVASDELNRLQIRDAKTEGTVLKFIQDVPTRWNSMFYMIERFLKLKDYIYPVSLKCSSISEMLQRDEIEILDVVQILQPIECVIKEIGGHLYPTSSLIIPIIHCMNHAVNNCVPVTVCGNDLKNNIIQELQRRFKDLEFCQTLAISTILDPRFKTLHFEHPRATSSAISYINNLMKSSYPNNTVSKTGTSSFVSHNDNNYNLWNFHDILISSNQSFDEPGGINVELRQYLNQKIVARSEDPLKYWQSLKHAYPALFKIATRYLSVVATSVPSELLFSKAGIIKSDLRSRLTGKRLNALLFLGSLELADWELA